MISKRDVAQRLDISLEMATRHGLADGMTEAEFAALELDPPAWLVQSRANRTKSARPVWVTLTCVVCGYSEAARPKKWWPEFTYLSCNQHPVDAVPAPAAGEYRGEYDGVGSRFIGFVDSAV